jgi:CRP-like cAMP-binding protein
MPLPSEITLPGNHLLAALSPGDRGLLQPHLVVADLVQDAQVFVSGAPAGYVWFPHEGVISVVATDASGGTVEVATIGHEGMSGIAIALGCTAMANDAMVQVSGHGTRVDPQAFKEALAASPTLKELMLRYVMAVFTQVSQNAACNQLHHITTRCARWLLTTHDRVSGDTFSLTQEYLSMMLGVTRPSVSSAAASLQNAGLIRYTRGRITILDRAGLEGAACECYRIIDHAFERIGGDC